jgi:hypothetical protein
MLSVLVLTKISGESITRKELSRQASEAARTAALALMAYKGRPVLPNRVKIHKRPSGQPVLSVHKPASPADASAGNILISISHITALGAGLAAESAE